jgi:hypothetical protein
MYTAKPQEERREREGREKGEQRPLSDVRSCSMLENTSALPQV